MTLKEVESRIREFRKQLDEMSHENSVCSLCPKQSNEELVELLIEKAHLYEDKELYAQAVKLVGQKAVLRMTLEMELPLWKEDRDFVATLL